MNLNEWYSNAVTSHPGSSIRKSSLGHLKSWRTISISEFYEIPMGKKKVVPPRNLSKSEMSRSKRCDCRVKPRWRWRAWDTNKYRKDTKKTRIHDEPALETCVPLGTARKIGRDGWWWMMMMVVWNVECPIFTMREHQSHIGENLCSSWRGHQRPLQTFNVWKTTVSRNQERERDNEKKIYFRERQSNTQNEIDLKEDTIPHIIYYYKLNYIWYEDQYVKGIANVFQPHTKKKRNKKRKRREEKKFKKWMNDQKK